MKTYDTANATHLLLYNEDHVFLKWGRCLPPMETVFLPNGDHVSFKWGRYFLSNGDDVPPTTLAVSDPDHSLTAQQIAVSDH